jgi:hypothetical protein
MNVGYLDGEISRSQATKRMKAAGYKYGSQAFWLEWRRCYARLESGRYLERHEPRCVSLSAEPASGDVSSRGSHLEGGLHTGSSDVA